ncbi:MAG: hypothetical protein R3B91_15005 [Planctomycetaceae bacterium]
MWYPDCHFVALGFISLQPRYAAPRASSHGNDFLGELSLMMLDRGVLRQLVRNARPSPRSTPSMLSFLECLLVSFFTSSIHLLTWFWGLFLIFAAHAKADLPSPVLEDLFPLGVQAGQSVVVNVSGPQLEKLTTLHISVPRIQVEKTGDTTFRLTVPENVPARYYEVSAVVPLGITSPRLFHVSRKQELIETEGESTPLELPMNSIISGRIASGGEIDRYRFVGTASEVVSIECWANRIESQLRGVLELFDPNGRRLAVSRGEVQLDPRIDVQLPADGEYELTLTDLTYSGSRQHFYRLALGNRPRVDFTDPIVVTRGTTTRVRLFGQNLGARSLTDNVIETAAVLRNNDDTTVTVNRRDLTSADSVDGSSTLSWVDVDITVPPGETPSVIPMRLSSAQASVDFLANDVAGADEPALISVTDVPVVKDDEHNHSADEPQLLNLPCEVSGRLIAGDEQDWYTFEAKRGEVLWFEAFGERIGSPVDLDLVLLDHTAEYELLHLSDQLESIGPGSFPTTHLDPVGHWVVPADGRYLLLLRNLQASLQDNLRRVYRLSIRRVEQDYDVVVVPHRTAERTGLNVWRQGRVFADLIALRHRGMTGPIRISAEDLPTGIECPDVWIGPEVDVAPLVITAGRDVPLDVTSLRLTAHADMGMEQLVRAVRGGASAVSQSPVPAGRLISEITLGVGPQAPFLVTAQPLQSDVSQGGLVEVQVTVERHDTSQTASCEMTGVCLPPLVRNEISEIAAGENEGWISFDLPAQLPPGPYTFAVQLVTEAAINGVDKTSVKTVSNPITINVAPAPFLLSVDPRTPRKIARGEIIKLNYTADRQNGFIGKIHTELRATGGLRGLRGRGVTFVGGTSTGEIQVIASDDAPLGPVKFLHLDAVGTVEDQPVYRSGCFVDLEITP